MIEDLRRMQDLPQEDKDIHQEDTGTTSGVYRTYIRRIEDLLQEDTGLHEDTGPTSGG